MDALSPTPIDDQFWSERKHPRLPLVVRLEPVPVDDPYDAEALSVEMPTWAAGECTGCAALVRRLADGRQTPCRGHPVFVA